MEPDLYDSEPGNTFTSFLKQRIRLRPGVTRNHRAPGNTILIPPEGTAPTRISRIGEEILPLLFRGTSKTQLENLLKERYPDNNDISSKLAKFISQLERNGLLESSCSQVKTSGTQAMRIEIRNPDPLAHKTAGWLNKVPRWLRWLSFTGSLLLGFCGLGQVLPGKKEAVFLDVFYHFDLLGFAVFLLIVIPLHEFAHAVACRLAKAPVSGAGIIFHHRLIPGPYVDTTQGYRVMGRWKRFKIPAAGPFVDFMASGVAAWVIIWTGQEGPLTQTAYFVMCISLLFLCLDMNPFNPSDGSHMLETLLNDELVREVALSRRRSSFCRPSAILIYRGICAAYIGLTVVVISRIAYTIP